MNGLDCKRQLVVLAVSIVALSATWAAPPEVIRYQGRLTDDAGVPLAGGHNVSFAIFDTATGGSSLWVEGPRALTLENGVVDVLLGELTPLASNVFTGVGERWLEVSVGGAVLGPRQRLSSVPYAHASDRLGDKALAEVLDRSAHTGTQPPSSISPQGVGSGLDADTVDGLDANKFIDTSSASQGKIGSLALGTAVPSATLHVVGNSRVDGNVQSNLSSGYVAINSYSSSTVPSIQMQNTGSTNDWVIYSEDASPSDLYIVSRLAGADVRIIGQSGFIANLIVDGNVTASNPTAGSHLVTQSYADANYKDPPGQWTCTVRSGSQGFTSTATCVGSEKAINGGCSYGGDTNDLRESRPTNQGWRCNSDIMQVIAYANCCL